LQEQISRFEKEQRLAQQDLAKLAQNVENLNKDLKSRMKKWSELLKHNTKKVRQNFDKYLQKKGFAGLFLIFLVF
jgi:ElaB/YqjD/DUF883 family membrane-anchored ribosome-binding protein